MCGATRVPHEYASLRALPAPFLHFPQPEDARIKNGNRTRPTAVVAYAVDVTIFVTAVADFVFIVEAIKLFEQL